MQSLALVPVHAGADPLLAEPFDLMVTAIEERLDAMLLVGHVLLSVDTRTKAA